MSALVRIVGCGRSSMGDDQAGLAVANRLAEHDLPATAVAMTETPGSELALAQTDGVRLLIIVDAALACENHPAGSFELFDYRERSGAFSEKAQSGTHGLGVCGGLELGDTLGLLPSEVWICAVFGSSFERRLELSAPVAAIVEAAAARVAGEVRRWLRATERKDSPSAGPFTA